jgi:ATP-dependent DNA helicase DinG
MRGEIVALDLETTGLDPERDAIIEIGAVKFDGDQIIDTFETFVNPGRPIPANITALTGIEQRDVESAPALGGVLPRLVQFVGNRPVLGHNVDFDLGFLRHRNVLRRNLPLDTYELASVMLPTTPRYSLAAIAAALGLEVPAWHRALNDAQATRAAYLALWERILALPLDTLSELAEASRALNWSARPVFEAALKERAKTAFSQAQERTATPFESLIELFGASPPGWEPLRPNPALTSLDIDALAALLEPGGALSDAFPSYEYRPQQVDMLAAIADAFNNGYHLMVEAGTGIGKTIAYLLPAIHWAMRNRERVVISTNTINLQDQLIYKDIPLLDNAFGFPFRATVLKGRGNYLCPRRLAALRRRGPTSVVEMRVFAKILVWLLESRSGDRSEITLRGPAEQSIWARLSAEDEGCTLDRCARQMNGACPFYKARRAAESAHIVIVNHALLLSDVVVGNRVLPDYRFLIVDEAHHLEDATTRGLSFQVDAAALERRLADLGGPRTGLLGDVLARTGGAISPQHHATLADYVNRIHQAAGAMRHHVGVLFETMRDFLKQNANLRPSEYTIRVRITDETRRHSGWGQVQAVWEVLSHFTDGIADAMHRLTDGLENLKDFDIPAYDDLLSSASAAARHLEEVHLHFHAIVAEPDPNIIYWVQVAPGTRRLSIHAAPLEVGPLIDRYLWTAKESVILTSATLRTAGSFDFIRERLGASKDQAQELAVGSPFDYEGSTLLYLIADIPEPTQGRMYQQKVEEGLTDLCLATGGRALILFTSYAQLRRTSQAIGPALDAEGITVYAQSDGTSRQHLLEGFRETEHAVLFGTRSFWEGVDVPGEALSVLCIVRLPFSVPSDPIFAARSETYADRFNEYALPETILRFRQGFGRLIRTRTDRGVVAVFDRRILSRSYGRAFVASLPPCTVQQGSLAQLPGAARRWLFDY